MLRAGFRSSQQNGRAILLFTCLFVSVSLCLSVCSMPATYVQGSGLPGIMVGPSFCVVLCLCLCVFSMTVCSVLGSDRPSNMAEPSLCSPVCVVLCVCLCVFSMTVYSVLGSDRSQQDGRAILMFACLCGSMCQSLV